MHLCTTFLKSGRKYKSFFMIPGNQVCKNYGYSDIINIRIFMQSLVVRVIVKSCDSYSCKDIWKIGFSET